MKQENHHTLAASHSLNLSMKLALILNIINPTLSGVLIRGEKGTAKSTAVRALADILPEIEVINNSPFQLSPREDPDVIRGCLSLVSDELFSDETPLETVTCKVSVVELPVGATEDRVVGTMNPEEGELRPQLLDRFGLCVHIEGITDPEARFEIANYCLDVGVDGHRGDIIILKTAKTLAAFDGRTEVIHEDIDTAAELALPHRRAVKFSVESTSQVASIKNSQNLTALLPHRVRRQPLQDIVVDVQHIRKQKRGCCK